MTRRASTSMSTPRLDAELAELARQAKSGREKIRCAQERAAELFAQERRRRGLALGAPLSEAGRRAFVAILHEPGHVPDVSEDWRREMLHALLALAAELTELPIREVRGPVLPPVDAHRRSRAARKAS